MRFRVRMARSALTETSLKETSLGETSLAILWRMEWIRLYEIFRCGGVFIVDPRFGGAGIFYYRFSVCEEGMSRICGELV